jgi:hypothetical protein
VANHGHPKPAECFAFRWRRREKGEGFRWERDQSGRCLLVGPPDDQLLEYEPLVEETGLFLTFAHLDQSEKAFLGFANKYGRLGTYHSFGPEHGEPLDEWRQHHRWMRFLAGVRSGCLGDRGVELDKVVRWTGDEVLYSFPRIGTGATEMWRHRGWLRQCPQGKNGQPLFRPGDLQGPARWFLAYAIDDWLRELQIWAKPIAPRMIWSADNHRPQFLFSPNSLLGALVCQFAAALHGAWPFKECTFCHRFFRLAPGINRANRLTCSHTCKQYLHNQRVARARKLHAEGRTIRQIVSELDVKPHGRKSSVELVKTWIARE